jgi:hypothetical protein
VAQRAEPQAILVAPTEAAIFLMLVVENGREDVVRELLARDRQPEMSGLTAAGL